MFSPKNKQKFSVIGSLNKDFKINDVYEFVLEYPNEEYSIHWTQSASPIETTTNVGITQNHGDSRLSSFQGLARSADKVKSLLDGTPGNDINNWWFSVGTIINEYKHIFLTYLIFGLELNHMI